MVKIATKIIIELVDFDLPIFIDCIIEYSISTTMLSNNLENSWNLTVCYIVELQYN